MSQSRNILVAYDGSSHADFAVDEAARLFPGDRAVVATAWSPVGDAADAARAALSDSVIQDAVAKIDAAAEQAARETAERGAARAEAAGMSASAVAVRGSPAIWPCLLEAADEHDAAAVVSGSRGRSKLQSALLGSVSSGLVQHSARPVVVVRDDAGR